MSEQMDDNNLVPNENVNYSNDSSDDVIPNAIVIKNIPFAIKKEQLLDIIDEMGLPLPYAFNYHFDNGIFRGLAFANFTTTEETLQVINDLNGKDINGRKLKVEYKKLLPQHERDRIEREKREKRGQLEEQHRQMSNLSLQSLNRVASNSNLNNSTTTSNNNNSTSNNNSNSNNNATPQLFNQYISSQTNLNSGYNNFSSTSLNQYGNTTTAPNQQPLLVAQHTANSTYSNSNYNAGSIYSSTTNINNNGERYYAPLPSSSNVSIPPQQLDFNDPDTLEIYSQLLLFKDRELKFAELAYPMGLSANHKRIINVLCSFLNLMEVYDSRFVIIRRKNNNNNTSGNVLDQNSLQNHLQQVQSTYSNSSIIINNNNNNSILQPTSTGGSLNRSTSYTSLLQAHASTMSQSLNNNNNNNNNPVSSTSIQSTPKLSHSNVISSSSLLQNPQSGTGSPNNFLNSLYNNSGNNGSSDQIQHPQPVVSQQLQSPQQQQQSFIRQQATLTPSSRVPSGYSNHHQKINIANPLLRNSGISPTGGNISTNSGTTPSANTPNSTKLASSLYNNSSNSNLLNSSNNSNNNNDQINPLVAQHTNGSIHSNFSIQSYHDDGNVNTYNNQTQQNNSQSAMMNTNDLIYKTLSQSGAVDNADLDNHLARSLSGLDIQDTPSSTKKNTIW